ncbi:hypothetical protein SLS58_002298 [Diplodia intermedia]|uniref:Uncharacterized protein n=1 Tax=Diplodia intermedia TaxID=856260 RepID=A0ABR3TZ57_9PEZI
MPLRADFTSGPSQQQDSDARAASGEEVDNSLVELHDAHQRGVILLEEDERNAVPSLGQLAGGLGVDAAASLLGYIAQLRNNQRRPEQVSYEQTTREISGKYPMHPSVSDYVSYGIFVGEIVRTNDAAVQGRFVANVRAERGNGVEAVSQGFRGATYGEALRNLWQGVADTYRLWTDFPVEEGENAREALSVPFPSCQPRRH